MNTAKVLEVLRYIKGAYNRFEINEEMPRVYNDFLKDESFEDVMVRLKNHIKISKFEPTINDLLPSKGEKERQINDREVARNHWISEGNDPNEFRYNSPTGA